MTEQETVTEFSPREDPAWAHIAIAARNALHSLGHYMPECLPSEINACGGGYAHHAATYYGTLAAVVEDRVVRMGMDLLDHVDQVAQAARTQLAAHRGETIDPADTPGAVVVEAARDTLTQMGDEPALAGLPPRDVAAGIDPLAIPPNRIGDPAPLPTTVGAALAGLPADEITAAGRRIAEATGQPRPRDCDCQPPGHDVYCETAAATAFGDNVPPELRRPAAGVPEVPGSAEAPAAGQAAASGPAGEVGGG